MTLVHSAATAALAILLATPAQAVNVTTPVSTCRPYPVENAETLADHVLDIGYTQNRNADRVRTVLCPILRSPDGNGVTVLIRGNKNRTSVARAVCTVFSYRADGSLARAITRNGPIAPGGDFTFSFPFTAAQAPATGHLNATCELSQRRLSRLFQIQTVD